MNLQDEYTTINLNEHFVLYRPAEKITGDFYWSKTVNNNLIVCVADFSAQVIPESEISQFGIYSLNEIIHNFETNSDKKISVSNIINKLMIKLKSSFPEESKKLIKSLNISLAIIDLNSNNNIYDIQWAGINNPLYFVKNTKLDSDDTSIIFYEKSTLNSNLYEINANEISVENINSENLSLTNHSFKLLKGDVIYLFSDGLVDQIGGPFGKKFMSNQLKNIIIDMTDNEIEDQKFVLDYAFELWKGDYPQIDDICIIGLKL